MSVSLILGDSPTSHSRSNQLPMLMPCRVQAAAGGQNVIGSLLTLTVSWLALSLSVYPVLENMSCSRLNEHCDPRYMSVTVALCQCLWIGTLLVQRIRVNSARWRSRPVGEVGPRERSARRRSRPAGEVGPRIILKWEAI